MTDTCGAVVGRARVLRGPGGRRSPDVRAAFVGGGGYVGSPSMLPLDNGRVLPLRDGLCAERPVMQDRLS